MAVSAKLKSQSLRKLIGDSCLIVLQTLDDTLTQRNLAQVLDLSLPTNGGKINAHHAMNQKVSVRLTGPWTPYSSVLSLKADECLWVGTSKPRRGHNFTSK